jgi:uncharacterized protein YPO0396
MSLNIMDKKLTIEKEGRPAKDEEIGTALWYYHEALSTAERQIDELRKLLEYLAEDNEDLEEVQDYLEVYEDLEETEELDYQIEENKQALFHAMKKNNESAVSKFSNLINLLNERKENLEKEVANG